MVEKKITRKVIPPSKKDSSVDKAASVEESRKVSSKEDRPAEEKIEGVLRAKRACLFCQSKTNPSYTDINVLRRFVTERAKIVLKVASNLCSKHQRAMTKQVKYARHLSLLPFTPKV